MSDSPADTSSHSVFSRIATLSAAAQAENGRISTVPFLAACSEILPFVDKLGTAFALVRVDVNGNISRLNDRQATDPTRYSDLFNMVESEKLAGEQASSSSATSAVLWLKRAMEFVASLFERLCLDENLTLADAASNAYTDTLYQYHNWITYAAFSVALKLVPHRDAFVAKFDLPQDVNPTTEMQVCLKTFKPMLAVVHDYLVKQGLDDPSRV